MSGTGQWMHMALADRTETTATRADIQEAFVNMTTMSAVAKGNIT